MYEILKDKIKTHYGSMSNFGNRLGLKKSTLSHRFSAKNWKPDEIELVKKVLNYDLDNRDD